MSKALKEFYNRKSKVYKFKITPGSIYEKIYKLIGDDQKILDVGCANGYFSRELKRKNNTIYGIEVSDKMAKEAGEVLDKVIVGNIEEINLPWKKGTFDTILLMDVLEHLFDPEKALLVLKPYLKKDGSIFVTLPNIANWEIRKNLFFGKFEYGDAGILERGHIRFFTYKTALSMFKGAGLRVKRRDLVMNLPLVILKIHNRLLLLHIDSILKKYFPNMLAYQFIFELKIIK